MSDYRDYLAHHGILGMKWGIRRFRNYDGSLTNAGRKRYDSPGNLRYKKTAKEQEARKEKRRTRAKQIAKGLAAAALVGGAGYAAYKLSKKAPALARKARGYDPLMDININPTNGPVIINKKTGHALTDEELKKLDEKIERERPDRMYARIVNDYSNDHDIEMARYRLGYDGLGRRKEDAIRFVQNGYKEQYRMAALRTRFNSNGYMIIHPKDSDETQRTKDEWNYCRDIVSQNDLFEKMKGVSSEKYGEWVKKYGDPYLKWRSEHPEFYDDHNVHMKEWDI